MPFFLFWHRAPPLRDISARFCLRLLTSGIVLGGLFIHFRLWHRSCALQQLPRFPQQSFNALERGDLFVWDSIQILLLMAQLELERFLTLFQFHQALRQSRDGLSEIFRSTGDPKGHRGRHHRIAGGFADHNTGAPLSQDQADMTQSRPMPSLATLALYLLAGTAIGLLALLNGIPAAPLAGALLGAGIVSMSGQLEPATWPPGTRTVLEIGIGTVIGTGLTRASLEQLQILWKPAVLITLALVLTGLVVGLWTSRLLGIDPIVALLGAAPGGISGMSLVGAEFGVGAAVAALHAVRLITVLLVLPLVVRLIVPSTAGG